MSEEINNDEIKQENDRIEDNNDRIIEDDIPNYNQKPNFNFFDTIIMYVSSFFEETVLYSLISIKSFSEIILNKPYNFLASRLENNDNPVINWLDNNVLSNYIININSSIKIAGILFIVLSMYILILNMYVFSQYFNIKRLEYDIKNVKLILDVHEHTLNNFAKIGFNYLVDGNCSILSNT